MIPVAGGRSPLQAFDANAACHPSPGKERREPAPSGISLDHLLGLFWRRRTLFIVVSSAVFLLAGLAIATLPRLYTASARLMIEAQPSRMVDIVPVVGALPEDRAAVLSELEIIRSPEIVQEVVAALRLDRLTEFNPDATASAGTSQGWLRPAVAAIGNHVRTSRPASTSQPPAPDDLAAEQQRSRIVEQVLKRLDAVSLGESRVIEVRFTSRDPRLAAAVADQIVASYVDRRRELQLAANQETNRWLNERLRPMEADVHAAEEELQQFREQMVRDHDLDLDLVDQQLTKLGTLVVEARADLDSRKAELSRIEAAAAQTNQVASLSLFDSPTLERLRAELIVLRQRKAELARTYGARHPQSIELDGELQRMEQQIHAEVLDVVAGTRTKVTIADDHLRSLQADLDRLQQERLAATRAQIRLDALQRAAEARRTVLAAFLQRERETAQITDEQPQARVVSKASVPANSSQPKFLLLFVGAAAIAGLAGVGAVLGVENARRAGFLSLDEIESAYDLPAYAVVPELSRKQLRRAGGNLVTDAITRYDSMPSEALRATALGIVGAVRTRGYSSTVLFTSAMPQEGTSSIAAGTAVALASFGWRVLIIDADPRRPRVAGLLGIARMVSLADLGSQGARPNDLVQPSPLGNLNVMTLGVHSQDMARSLVRSHVLQTVIDHLKQRYDFVLIDAPPVLTVSDTRLLLAMTQHCVMVVRWNRTSRKAVDHAMQQLADAGGLTSGIVLNRVNVRRMAAFDCTESHIMADASYRRHFAIGRRA